MIVGPILLRQSWHTLQVWYKGDIIKELMVQGKRGNNDNLEFIRIWNYEGKQTIENMSEFRIGE